MGGPYTVSAQTCRIDRRQPGDDLSAAVADRQLSQAERPHLPDARHLGERPVRGELHPGLVCALQPLRHLHHQLGHRGDRGDCRQPVRLHAGRVRLRPAAVPAEGDVVRDHADDDHAALPRSRGAAVHHLQPIGLGEHIRPTELDEAARIDGCGHWKIFSRVMLPLMGPAIATTAIFTFIWTWSDFFTPLIYLTNPLAY